MLPTSSLSLIPTLHPPCPPFSLFHPLVCPLSPRLLPSQLSAPSLAPPALHPHPSNNPSVSMVLRGSRLSSLPPTTTCQPHIGRPALLSLSHSHLVQPSISPALLSPFFHLISYRSLPSQSAAPSSYTPPPPHQRIYGTAWESSDQLAAYNHLKAEAARRDHRKLGQELNLFSIQEEAGGFLGVRVGVGKGGVRGGCFCAWQSNELQQTV